MIEVSNIEHALCNGNDDRYLFVLFVLSDEQGSVYNAVWNGWDTKDKKLLYFDSIEKPSNNTVALEDSKGIKFIMSYEFIKDDKKAYTLSSEEVYKEFENGNLDVERLIVEYLL